MFLQTIREIEALLEADIAAGDFDHDNDDLENRPPKHHSPSIWNPSMANRAKEPGDMYDNYEKIAQSALPVSAKTLNRIPEEEIKM